MEMTAMINSDAASLAISVQSLPPELSDTILNFTLDLHNHQRNTAGKPRATTIDRFWRPPPTLQVDRKSREAGAKVYYGSNTFQFESEDGLADSIAWLARLPPSHVRKIRKLRLCNIGPGPDDVVDCSSMLYLIIWGQLSQPRQERTAALKRAMESERLRSRWQVSTRLYFRLGFRFGDEQKVHHTWVPLVGQTEFRVMQAISKAFVKTVAAKNSEQAAVEDV